MNLVVDASVLVGELLRRRGRELLQNPELKLYAAEMVLNETRYELRRRIGFIASQGRLIDVSQEELLAMADRTIDTHIELVAASSYARFEKQARRRIPQDPNDWPTVACALMLPAAIWTQDNDFLGCGCPTWTTTTLLLELSSP